jgi:maleamate amidohydrolase
MRAVENTAKLLEVARRRYNVPVASCNTAYMNEREMPYWKITAVRETFRHDHPSSALDPRIHDPKGYTAPERIGNARRTLENSHKKAQAR